jgi:hypothetical protein
MTLDHLIVRIINQVDFIFGNTDVYAEGIDYSYLSNNYVLYPTCVPGTILGPRQMVVNKINSLTLCRAGIVAGER